VRIGNDPKALVAECRKVGRAVPVAIEATYGWYWAVDALLAAGFEVHLAHPLGMKALRKRKRVKTDPADAYELANLLRLGSLPEAYISPPDLRELRELVRHRRQLVKLATAVKAGIRALLAPTSSGTTFGSPRPSSSPTPPPPCWTHSRCPAPTRPGWPPSAG
jgi:transposase